MKLLRSDLLGGRDRQHDLRGRRRQRGDRDPGQRQDRRHRNGGGPVRRARSPAFSLARYLPGGRSDDTFGDGGRVITTAFGRAETADMAIGADGRIVVVGTALPLGSPQRRFAVARYLPSGELDPAFGGDGMVMTRFRRQPQAWGVAIQPDGKIVVAGSNDGRFVVARYRRGGALDPEFSGDGRRMERMGW